METAVMISQALNVPIDEIVEITNVKKINKVWDNLLYPKHFLNLLPIKGGCIADYGFFG